MSKIDRNSRNLNQSRIPPQIWLVISFLIAMVLWYILSIIPTPARSYPNVE